MSIFSESELNELPIEKRFAMESQIRQVDDAKDIEQLKTLTKMLIQHTFYKDYVVGKLIRGAYAPK